MLRKFEVENFRGFESRLVWDLTAGRYDFNPQVESEGLVKNAIIYGPNGSGKSALGLALFDIILHLTDKERLPAMAVMPYRNLNRLKEPAQFRYEFQFGSDRIVYAYAKKEPEELVWEKLFLNDECLVDYDFFDGAKRFVSKTLVGALNIDLVDNKLSIIKYIYRNTPTNKAPVVTQLIRFCENMLWYRSLSDGNLYAGFQNGTTNLDELFYQNNTKREEFEAFLRENGMHYETHFLTVEGKHLLFAKFKDAEAPFGLIASTGTLALYLFFMWSISAFPKISLLFIDEFDAFLHYESSAAIVRKLNGAKNFQTFLTTHNTSLMNNDLTRPDACFLLGGEDSRHIQIKSLANSTDREIRRVHNLEKMYRGGAFNA
jgi:hypothetical protein